MNNFKDKQIIQNLYALISITLETLLTYKYIYYNTCTCNYIPDQNQLINSEQLLEFDDDGQTTPYIGNFVLKYQWLDLLSEVKLNEKA